MRPSIANPSCAFCVLTFFASVGLGCGDGGSSPASQKPLAGITAVAIGETFACGLTTGGGVLAWGSELGGGTDRSSPVPVAVPGFSSGVAAISAGQAEACMLTKAGAVQCWGELSASLTFWAKAPVAVEGLSSGVAAISVGRGDICALMSSGAVLCGHHDGTELQKLVPVPGLPADISAISTGGYHACALTKGGAVLCWGQNSAGQLGDNSTVDSVVPVGVMGLGSGVTSISAGEWQTCAVKAGSVLCWGGTIGFGGVFDHLNVVPAAVGGLAAGVVSVSAGSEQVCVVTANQSVMCWGNNAYGELGDESTNGSTSPVAVVGLSSGVAAVSAGEMETCALTATGGVSCWGRNYWGELGDGTTTDRDGPVQVLAP
jgi:alpha-tubulin suppressor-like RCC1 family protein